MTPHWANFQRHSSQRLSAIIPAFPSLDLSRTTAKTKNCAQHTHTHTSLYRCEEASAPQQLVIELKMFSPWKSISSAERGELKKKRGEKRGLVDQQLWPAKEDGIEIKLTIHTRIAFYIIRRKISNLFASNRRKLQARYFFKKPNRRSKFYSHREVGGDDYG